MRLRFACVVSLVALTNVTLVGQTGFPADNTSYLSWNTKMIETITKKFRVNGQVGGSFDFRIRNTERSYNYKLRATWFTPEMVRASARYWQLRERLSEEQTRVELSCGRSIINGFTAWCSRRSTGDGLRG